MQGLFGIASMKHHLLVINTLSAKLTAGCYRPKEQPASFFIWHSYLMYSYAIRSFIWLLLFYIMDQTAIRLKPWGRLCLLDTHRAVWDWKAIVFIVFTFAGSYPVVVIFLSRRILTQTTAAIKIIARMLQDHVTQDLRLLDLFTSTQSQTCGSLTQSAMY